MKNNKKANTNSEKEAKRKKQKQPVQKKSSKTKTSAFNLELGSPPRGLPATDGDAQSSTATGGEACNTDGKGSLDYQQPDNNSHQPPPHPPPQLDLQLNSAELDLSTSSSSDGDDEVVIKDVFSRKVSWFSVYMLYMYIVTLSDLLSFTGDYN